MSRVSRFTSLITAVLIAGSSLVYANVAPTAVAGSAAVVQTANATAASVAAPEAATTAAKAKSSDAVDNPYGLDALWKGGDVVAKSTLLILVVMSVGSWYILITKLLEQVRLEKQARDAHRTFWTAGGLKEAVATLKTTSPFYFIAKSGVEATEHHEGLLGNIDLNTWVTISIQRATGSVQSRLQNGLAFLATVGSTGPFVGLFGTVWGIYHALTAIGIAGQASIDKVAGPVGESLIMTAIGLAVAVPAVLGYNWLVRRNKAVLEKVRDFGADLHAVLLGASIAPANTKAAVRSATQAGSAPQPKLAVAATAGA